MFGKVSTLVSLLILSLVSGYLPMHRIERCFSERELEVSARSLQLSFIRAFLFL